jgi:DNA primase small subunit
MNEKTKRFVQRKFKEYYSRARIKIPTDLRMREWGFVLFDQYFPDKLLMRRHKSFTVGKELVDYLKENTPAHAYFSSALYNFPGADMPNKGWIGSDLIFDLDADHIISESEVQKYSYEDLLGIVKEETLKLVDFLINDFGFSEEAIELAFSGSRGYHIHIETEDVRSLGSRERREIVDYVMATGLDMNNFLASDSKDVEDLELIPDGWGKRLLNGLIEFLHEIAEMEEEEAIGMVKKIGEMEKKKAKEIIRIAKDQTVMKRIERGQIPRFAKSIRKEITTTVTKAVSVKSADRVDEPVTADIKRLIRLPTSLHGKSSLEVKPLRIETFEDFNPLEDAVVFDDAPVEIHVDKSTSIKLKGESYIMEAGEVTSVPEHVALYCMCRGVAELNCTN